jgi:hypothetical protein
MPRNQILHFVALRLRPSSPFLCEEHLTACMNVPVRSRAGFKADAKRAAVSSVHRCDLPGEGGLRCL